MAGEVLTAEDRAYFLAMMRRQTDSAVHRRMNVLLLLDDGWTVERICEALFIDEATVRQHRRLYETKGRGGVESLTYAGAESPFLAEQLQEVADWVDAQVPQTVHPVGAFIAARFGRSYPSHALAKLLKRLGFVDKKPKTVPAKAAAVQGAFVAGTLAPLMAAASEEAPLDFVDATHPSYPGRPAHGWIRKAAASN